MGNLKAENWETWTVFLALFFNTNENRDAQVCLTKCFKLCSSFSAWIWKGHMRFQKYKNNANWHMFFIFFMFQNQFPVSCISSNFWRKHYYACRWFKEVEGEKQHMFKRTCGKHFPKKYHKVSLQVSLSPAHVAGYSITTSKFINFHTLKHHKFTTSTFINYNFKIYQFTTIKFINFDVTCPPSFILRF